MDTIIRIEDVIIEKISANDAELSHIFGLSKKVCGRRRREMKKMPSQQKHLLDCGSVVLVKGFQQYLAYRGSQAWKKEMAKIEKAG
ncbi:hypothetical protein ACXM1Q_000175 [Streptococcus sp. 10F2]